MNTVHKVPALLSVIAASLLLGACASGPSAPMGAADTRSKLVSLQGDPQLANRAPVAIKLAETAVIAAEKPTDDEALGQHRVIIADRKVETARALAETRLLEEQRTQLSSQRESARLESRTREADMAHRATDMANAENEALRVQLADLNAQETERGLAITLGDVLFATDKAELLGGGASHLDKLVTFLQQEPERTVLIEGHTDSVGNASYNLALSQRRADSVKNYLQTRGISGNRLSASGQGQSAPVASNDTTSGRQMNRRVEVIISHSN